MKAIASKPDISKRTLAQNIATIVAARFVFETLVGTLGLRLGLVVVVGGGVDFRRS